MHSSFKTKHNFNRRHSYNPYPRNSPFGSTPFHHSVRDQGSDIHLQNTQEPRILSPSLNCTSESTQYECDTLPLKLVFSRTINTMPAKRIYSDADPNVYFRRKSTEITEQPLQPISCPEIPKSRPPLANLKQENTTEPSFRDDSYQTFRSISDNHTSIASNKENCAQQLNSFEDFNLRPPRKQTPSSSDQQQQKTKHMFDFGTGSRVNSDGCQQNVSHKLMSSADFLFTLNNYRCSSPAANGFSSPHLSVPSSDEDNLFLESLRQSVSPILDDTAAVHQNQPVPFSDDESAVLQNQRCTAFVSNYDNVLDGMEQLTCRESGKPFSPNPSPPAPVRTPDSFDHFLDVTLSSSEDGLSVGSSCRANVPKRYCGECVFDSRQQTSCSRYQEGSRCCYGGCGQDIVSKRCYQAGSGQGIVRKRCYQAGSGQNIVNKRCDQRGSGRSSSRSLELTGHNYSDKRFGQGKSDQNDVTTSRNDHQRRKNYLDGRLNQRKSDHISVNSSRNYDDIGQKLFDRRFNHQGTGKFLSVGRTNVEAVGQNCFDRNYNQGGSGQNFLNGEQNCGIGQECIGTCYTQEEIGLNLMNNNRNHHGIEMNLNYGRPNQGGRIQNSVDVTQNHDGIRMGPITRMHNQEGRMQDSVDIIQNHNGIGINCSTRRHNQEGSLSSVENERNNTIKSEKFERKCDDVELMEFDELTSLLSDNFYIGGKSDSSNSVSSEAIISRDLLNRWRIPSNTLNLDHQQNDCNNNENIRDCRQNDQISTGIIRDRRQNDHINDAINMDCQLNDYIDSEIIHDHRQNDHVNTGIIPGRRQSNCTEIISDNCKNKIDKLISDGSTVDDVARGGNRMASSVNDAHRTFEKGFGRFPLISYPDEE